MRKTPSEYARWVRRVHEMVDDCPLDIHKLAVLCGGQVDYGAIHGFARTIVRANGVFGILVKEDDPPRRQRFTVGHELGHCCIPSHNKAATLCVSPELSRDDTDKSIEREANEFAAELLMPRHLVTPLVYVGNIDLARADEIGDRFDVSLMSAALKMCEITKERAAVLYFNRGQLKWSSRLGLPYGLPPRGSTPPGNTVAWDIVDGREGSTTATLVDTGAWLPLSRPDPSWGDLLESSVSLGSQGHVLTVLWLTLNN